MSDNGAAKTPRERVFNEIRRLGLERNVLELQENGLTLVEGALSPDMVERLRGGILNQVKRRAELDSRPDLDSYDGPSLPHGSWLLFEDPVFEEVLVNETMLALMHYQLGESMQLSNMWCHTRVSNTPDLTPLHADSYSGLYPSPTDFGNCNFALTDYERDLGALGYVPGSHMIGRQPVHGTGEDSVETNEGCVPIECPAGTAIVFTGSTWHGAYRRTVPGIRLNLSIAMNRPHLIPVERYRNSVTQEMLDRNPPKFASLLGQRMPLGMGDGETQDPDDVAQFVLRYTDFYG